MKRSLVLILVLIGALAVAWSGWWYYSGRLAMTAFQNWVAEQRDDGVDISYARVDLGGYPLTVALTVEQPGIAAPTRFWSVSSDRITISYKAWQFDHYRLTAADPIHITTAAVPESRQNPIALNSLKADYWRAVDQQPHRVQIHTQEISGPNGLAVSELALTGTRPKHTAADRETAALVARLELVQADFPGYLVSGLPTSVDAAVLDFSISGPEPDGPESFYKKLGLWRDAGGAIDVTDLALVWGDLNLQGTGMVTLDEELRPLSSFTVKAVGVSETARRFEDAGLIDATTRRYIELGAGLLSFGSSQSGAVNIPVSSQDGQLYLGPVAVAEVPSLIPGYTPPPQAVPAPVESFPDLPPPPTVSEETLNLTSDPVSGPVVNPEEDPAPIPVPSQ